MLNDGTGFKKVYIAARFTDLRRVIDGLARIIRFQFKLDPYDKNTLFLFCGKKTDRIKGLLWEGDGFLLLYKPIENGSFKWPRTADEVMENTPQQYRMLMHIFSHYPQQKGLLIILLFVTKDSTFRLWII